MMLAVGLHTHTHTHTHTHIHIYMTFIMLSYVPSIPTLMEIFIMNGC